MLLFMDGFDHYTSGANMALKWPLGTTPVNAGQPGRFSGYSVGVGSNTLGPGRGFANSSTVIVGFAIKIGQTNSPFGPVLYDNTGAGPQIGFFLDAGGNLSVRRGAYNNNATIGTLSGTYSTGVWYYIEIKVVFSTSATGSVTVNVNGSQVLNVTNVQTAQTANAYANAVYLYGTGTNNYVDDLYVCDTTGTSNNSMLGECKVITTFPTGNGRLSQWATQVGGTAGQPYTAVNENNGDGDTSYLSDNTAGDIHDFTLGSFGTITSVKGVQVNVEMRKDDVSAHTLGVGVGNGTTENFDSGTTVGSSYQMVNRTLDSNPLTSAAWTTGDLTSLQAAVKTIT